MIGIAYYVRAAYVEVSMFYISLMFWFVVLVVAVTFAHKQVVKAGL